MVSLVTRLDRTSRHHFLLLRIDPHLLKVSCFIGQCWGFFLSWSNGLRWASWAVSTSSTSSNNPPYTPQRVIGPYWMSLNSFRKKRSTISCHKFATCYWIESPCEMMICMITLSRFSRRNVLIAFPLAHESVGCSRLSRKAFLCP